MEIKNEWNLKPEDIIKKYNTLTNEQLKFALLNPEFTPFLFSVISKLNDNQLKFIIPLLSLDQIKMTIPKFQLQQTGVAIQVMNPSQIRQAIISITLEDRNLLLQNISLLNTSTNKDELQSFISFLDPLALAIAIQLPELTKRIIEAASVMTVEQLRVIIPLLQSHQIQDIMKVLEHSEQIQVVFSMIDSSKKEELIPLLITNFEVLEKQKQDLQRKIESVKIQLINLENSLKDIVDLNEPTKILTEDLLLEKYNSFIRMIKNTKNEIENQQKMIREIQASLKLPLEIFSNNDNQTNNYQEIYLKYLELSKVCTDLGKIIRNQFTTLTSETDGLMSKFNKNWELLKKKAGVTMGIDFNNSDNTINLRTSLRSSCDLVFIDEERAIILYEAIKKIGNPDAIGNHYSMSWSDIIQSGFRTEKDFEQKGITNLEQLEIYILSNKNKNI